MKILLIDNETHLLRELEKFIPGPQIVLKWNDLAGLDISGFDLIVLSGGSSFPIAGNESKLENEMRLIKECKIPLLGICYGCELIVQVFGGRLSKMPERHQGACEAKVIEPGGVFDGISSFTAYENHSWHIEKMPDDFIVLAESEHGIEAIKHKNLPIYGFQFHPEKTMTGAQKQTLFANLFQKILLPHK